MKNIKGSIAYKKIVLIGAICLLLSLVPILTFSRDKPTQSGPQKLGASTIKQESTVVYGIPVRLKIPIIAVDAAVSFVGLGTDGYMEAPKGGVDVGWYKTGARPGNNGTAVIDGHYGEWKNGEGSVFDNLNKLKKGDSIYVEDDHGETATFVVRELKLYKRSEKDSTVFNYLSDGKAYLSLITCQGNKSQGSYPDRLVVFSDKQTTSQNIP